MENFDYDDTDVVRYIKSALTSNPLAVTHILLVSFGESKERDQEEFFNRLANQNMELEFTVNGRTELVTLRWEAPATKRKCTMFYTSAPFYSDVAVLQATKKIIQAIENVIQVNVEFLVVTPMEFLDKLDPGFTVSLCESEDSDRAPGSNEIGTYYTQDNGTIVYTDLHKHAENP